MSRHHRHGRDRLKRTLTRIGIGAAVVGSALAVKLGPPAPKYGPFKIPLNQAAVDQSRAQSIYKYMDSGAVEQCEAAGGQARMMRNPYPYAHSDPGLPVKMVHEEMCYAKTAKGAPAMTTGALGPTSDTIPWNELKAGGVMLGAALGYVVASSLIRRHTKAVYDKDVTEMHKIETETAMKMQAKDPGLSREKSLHMAKIELKRHSTPDSKYMKDYISARKIQDLELKGRKGEAGSFLPMKWRERLWSEKRQAAKKYISSLEKRLTTEPDKDTRRVIDAQIRRYKKDHSEIFQPKHVPSSEIERL